MYRDDCRTISVYLVAIELEDLHSHIFTHFKQLTDHKKRSCCEIALINEAHLEHAL